MQELNTIQNQIFMGVGPSRIAVLSLILMADGTDADQQDQQALLGMCKTRINNAQAMLDQGTVSLAQQHDYQFSAAVEKARQSAAQALRSFHDLINRENFSVQRHADDIQALRTFGVFQLEQTITDFLGKMTKELLKETQLRGTQGTREMRNMVNDVDDLGRNIQLIAFNASVEAARIGEQGKGFSVIASEIRDLSNKMQDTLDKISGRLTTI
jgi:methyl-accepting chemotaxis protein